MANVIMAILVSVVLALPAQAGWKMYAPGQKGPVMTATETDEERASRLSNEEASRQNLEYQAARGRAIIEEEITRRARERQEQIDPMFYTCPAPVINDGPRPGGHRRHEWREITGFNTPAERTRYRREIQRLNSELKKDRAKPNPAGDHPSKIRKQFAPKF